MTTQSPPIPEVFTRYRDRIDAGLRAALEGPELAVYTMVRYQLGWVDEQGRPVEADRGKAIRPTLALLMCEALEGDPDAAVPAAAGLELLHNFSLIHDDVMDNDRTRRHRPTVWAIWGEAQAINAGDLLNVLATLSVLRATCDPETTALARAAVEVLARGCGRMTEGQHLDLAFEARDDVTVDEYLEMVYGKTAALIGVAFELGAIFAGNDPEIRARCRNYGRTLGAAFQIRDDLLGIWGDAAVTGKPVGGDIRKRKKTLPIVHAMQAAPPQDRQYLRRMFAGPSAEPDVAAAMAILDRADSQAFSEAEANRLLADARIWLDKLPVSDWGRRALTDVASFIIGRTK